MQSDLLQLTSKILASRRISRREQQRMNALLGQGNLLETEKILVNRIFYGMRHGLLTTID